MSNGTDAPVEDVNPIVSYYATVSRRLSDGTVFYPDQRLDRLQALKTYTLNAAYAAFEEDITQNGADAHRNPILSKRCRKCAIQARRMGTWTVRTKS